MMAFQETILKRQTKILDALRKGEIIESKLVHVTGIHTYSVQDILEDLEKRGLVKKRKNGKRTFWRKT